MPEMHGTWSGSAWCHATRQYPSFWTQVVAAPYAACPPDSLLPFLPTPTSVWWPGSVIFFHLRPRLATKQDVKQKHWLIGWLWNTQLGTPARVGVLESGFSHLSHRETIPGLAELGLCKHYASAFARLYYLTVHHRFAGQYYHLWMLSSIMQH